MTMEISKFKKSLNDYGICNIRICIYHSHACHNYFDISACVATTRATHTIYVESISLLQGLDLLVDKGRMLKELDATKQIGEKDFKDGSEKNAGFNAHKWLDSGDIKITTEF